MNEVTLARMLLDAQDDFEHRAVKDEREVLSVKAAPAAGGSRRSSARARSPKGESASPGPASPF